MRPDEEIVCSVKPSIPCLMSLGMVNCKKSTASSALKPISNRILCFLNEGRRRLLMSKKDILSLVGLLFESLDFFLKVVPEVVYTNLQQLDIHCKKE